MDGKTGEIDKNGNETVPLKYESQKMQTIWEKLLIPNMKQIKKYRGRTKFSESRTPFTIKRPYLLISTDADSECKMVFSKYSENIFSVKNVKTLVLQYNSVSKTQYYGLQGSRVSKNIPSYSSYFIYFDVAGKECIGYDYLPAPEFPYSIPETWGGLINSNEKIIKTIESHLAASTK